MKKSINCKRCGAEINKKAKVCPNCGEKPKRHIIRTVLISLLFIGLIGNIGEKNSNDAKSSNKTVLQYNQNTPMPEENTDISSNTLSQQQIDTNDYIKISDYLLYEYGQYMKGQNVITVITVEDATTDCVKATTDNNNSLMYSIICYMKNAKNIPIGSKITIAGTVQEETSIGSTISMSNCTIIENDEIKNQIANTLSEQRKMGESFKEKHNAQIAAEAKAKKDDYIKQCKTVKYSEVERNPDSFDGAKIKISGKDIQVSEGWFNSVTLRVSCNGNIWLATYTRDDDEKRILENDYITAYGQCNGVETYTAITGAKVTIPSLHIEYYN